jgi:hypothetical protein
VVLGVVLFMPAPPVPPVVEDPLPYCELPVLEPLPYCELPEEPPVPYCELELFLLDFEEELLEPMELLSDPYCPLLEPMLLLELSFPILELPEPPVPIPELPEPPVPDMSLGLELG